MAKQSTLDANCTNDQRRSFRRTRRLALAGSFRRSCREYQPCAAPPAFSILSHRALLQFTGPDRVSFLQGMLSNDLRPLKMFDGQQATILTQQGKVIADVRVLCAHEFVLSGFLGSRSKKRSSTHLNRYLVADEVEIHDPNEQWKMLSLQGPKAQAILDQLFANAELPTQANHHAMVQFDGTPICVVRADHSGVRRLRSDCADVGQLVGIRATAEPNSARHGSARERRTSFASKPASPATASISTKTICCSKSASTTP